MQRQVFKMSEMIRSRYSVDLHSTLTLIFYTFQGSVCCGYGAAGVDANGYDCVMIPGASMFAAGFVFSPAPNSVCGNGAGLVNALGGASTTLCSEYFCQKLLIFL